MGGTLEVLPARVLEALIDELTLRVFWKDTNSRSAATSRSRATQGSSSPPSSGVWTTS